MFKNDCPTFLDSLFKNFSMKISFRVTFSKFYTEWYNGGEGRIRLSVKRAQVECDMIYQVAYNLRLRCDAKKKDHGR
jgi:hypothetical protein